MNAQDKIGNVFYKLFKPFVKDKEKPKEMDRRLKKCGDQFFMTIYKLAITIFAFNVMKNADFFPKLLGGSGDYSTILDNFPYGNHIPYLK